MTINRNEFRHAKRVLNMFSISDIPNAVCSAIHWTSSLFTASSEPVYCVCVQRRFWRDCALRRLAWTFAVRVYVEHPFFMFRLITTFNMGRFVSRHRSQNTRADVNLFSYNLWKLTNRKTRGPWPYIAHPSNTEWHGCLSEYWFFRFMHYYGKTAPST